MNRSTSHQLRIKAIKARQTEQKRVNARRNAQLSKSTQEAA